MKNAYLEFQEDEIIYGSIIAMLERRDIMLEAYSTNIALTENSYVPLNNVSLEKGCTATKSSADTIELNKCGVYMVSVDASVETASTLQLYKDGVAQPQAQSTGLNPSFVTLVQVKTNNSCCACDSPTTLQIMNSIATQATDVNVVITKVV